MKRSASLARATVIAFLAAGPPLAAIGCSAVSERREGRSPGPCECDGLPAVDPRVPWAEWRDIRYSPDGQAVALVGVSLADGRLHVLTWQPDGTANDLVAPYEDFRDEQAGAWSADSRYYAKVVREGNHFELVTCDVADGSWNRTAPIDRWTTSPPAWNPFTSEVAVVVSTQSDAYRQASMDQVALAYPRLAERLGLQSRQDGHAQVAEPAIPLARILVASPQGGLIRERSIDGFPDGVKRTHLSWSPDGRFLLISSWEEPWESGEVRLLDAATLTVLDTLTGADCQLDAPPAWSPDGRRFAMASTGVTIVGVSVDGRFEPPHTHEWDDDWGWVRQMAWCPSGDKLLLFRSREAPDIVQFLSSFPTIACDNTPRRRIFSVWFFDPSTGEASECDDLRITNRGVNWSDAWMIPRAAEAFARWSR